ncbi:malto-oligosyltrehalose trehalohydrolase [Luteibacter sp.]|uniref:malto-oligosyltrehalose trehalohydrolase n=1 Tax=Luteibacter sp. TaxID=1886636 RepID=UPI003F7DBA6D
MSARFVHAMPYGARPLGDGGTRFRLWAPDLETVTLECQDGHTAEMRALDDGWFECICPRGAGCAYRFRIGEDLAVPDPASRRQLDGDVHGYSLVVDPAGYAWQNAAWQGRPWHDVVLYELHMGALGGFAAVERILPQLAALGITAVELMPIAEFAGSRNWGYDGVLPYAPAAAYGTPDELKALIDAAHGLGLMVFLDVVYNHFGPEGSYLHAYASGFFDGEADTPWGSAMAVSTPQVGDFFVHNALYWIEEFQVDGLRFDAVHAIANPGWLSALAARVHAAVGSRRQVHLVLENEANQANLLGRGRFDAQWNDDFHNALHVLLTREREGYYAPYADAPMEKLLRVLREGFAFQGEKFGERRRGESSAHLPPARFVNFLQNHDQVGNRAFGDRLTTLVEPEIIEAALVLLLLGPFVPMLFMGEEWGSRTPFQYFTDFPDEALRTAVREGRRKEFAAFTHFSGDAIPAPGDEQTFRRSVPRPDPEAGEARHTLIQRLLRLRAKHVAPHIDTAASKAAHAVGERAFVASWALGGGTLSLFVIFGDGDAPIDRPPPPGGAGLPGDAADIASLARGLLPARRALACLES